MRESLERIEAMNLPVTLSHVVTDRGFDGKEQEGKRLEAPPKSA